MDGWRLSVSTTGCLHRVGIAKLRFSGKATEVGGGSQPHQVGYKNHAMAIIGQLKGRVKLTRSEINILHLRLSLSLALCQGNNATLCLWLNCNIHSVPSESRGKWDYPLPFLLLHLNIFDGMLGMFRRGGSGRGLRPVLTFFVGCMEEWGARIVP